MRIRLLLTLFLLALAARAEAPAQGGFEILYEVDLESEAWSGVLIPEPGPLRNGRPTEAFRWQPARNSAPDSPALLADWSQVGTLRFWMHLGQPYPFHLTVVLTGAPDGYFYASVPIDFMGWKQFMIPISEFKPANDPDWSATNSLGFRIQGYSQPKLDEQMVIWFDEFAVQTKNGRSLRRANSLETNLQAWKSLAAKGNPFLLLNAERYRPVQPAFKAPKDLHSAWTYRSVAERLVAISYAAADPSSPHRGRQDLIDHAIAGVDWLLAEESPDGWWWGGKQPPEGDANVNRFVLAPLLDAVRFLRMTPAGQAALPRWKERLDKAVELQKRAYSGEIPWDRLAKAGGHYANQDAYYVLIMALAGEVFERPPDGDLAKKMMAQIARSLLPDGGIHYIGQEVESPNYHALNLVILGRYATLTKDPVAINLLKNTNNYFPLTSSAEGFPESWSDCWWKQKWSKPWRDAMVIAAGTTGDARNQYLLWRVLERSRPSDDGMATLYAAPYWTGTAPGEPPAEQWVAVDQNIRGVRGRAGNWYFGVTQGRGLRNTFVGGMITSPNGVHPLRTAFRGAQIDILEDTQRPNGFTLSQREDLTGVALQPGAGGAVGARFRLQPRTINGYPPPQTSDTPWQSTQVWYASVDGIVGQVTVEAMADAPAQAVVARLALGPGRPREKDGEWYAGPLRIRVLESFGTASVQPVPHFTTPIERTWPGLELRLPLPDGAKKGDRWTYAVWLGPDKSHPPDLFSPLAADGGFSATWAGQGRLTVLFNPTSTATRTTISYSRAKPDLWTGENGVEPAAVGSQSSIEVTLEPGQCAIAHESWK